MLPGTPDFVFTDRTKILLALFSGAAMLAILAAILVFGGIMPPFYKQQYEASAFGPAQLEYKVASFADLPGWLQDDPEQAFLAFLKSCDDMQGRGDDEPTNPNEFLGEHLDGTSLGGRVAGWREVCSEAGRLANKSHAGGSAKRSSLRSYFEFYFRPVQILDRREALPDGPARRSPPQTDATGVFTGYFEPAYEASRFPTAAFQAPLYPRPDDLIDINLGDFRDKFAGERLAGRIKGNKLIPFPDHRDINAGGLAGAVDPIAWLAPNDLFFLQIQGSGQLRFRDGEALRVGYAGQNGHPYLAIGRVMVERGIMPLEEVSMQSIRAWLDSAAPDEAKALREENGSYVFFRALGQPQEGLGPLGAQGVALTPGRSLAVDRRYHMLGAPVWVDIEPVDGAGVSRFQRLMIAQDTGGAIRGPIRGDVFWGAGDAAGEIAGTMNARGSMYVLVPRDIASRLPARRGL